MRLSVTSEDGANLASEMRYDGKWSTVYRVYGCARGAGHTATHRTDPPRETESPRTRHRSPHMGHRSGPRVTHAGGHPRQNNPRRRVRYQLLPCTVQPVSPTACTPRVRQTDAQPQRARATRAEAPPKHTIGSYSTHQDRKARDMIGSEIPRAALLVHTVMSLCLPELRLSRRTCSCILSARPAQTRPTTVAIGAWRLRLRGLLREE